MNYTCLSGSLTASTDLKYSDKHSLVRSHTTPVCNWKWGEEGFRAEKRSAQASAHPLSQAPGGNFLCVDFACLLLEFWVKCTRCERFLPVKHFYLTCLLFFPSLENYFGFRTTNVKGKTDHSVSLRWNKRFWTFLKRRVFFLIVHLINLWVDFAGLN